MFFQLTNRSSSMAQAGSPLGVILLLALCIGCTSAPLKKQQPDAAWVKRGSPIIDAHIHTHFREKSNRFSGIFDSEKSLLAEMKLNGVVGAVSHTDNYEKDYFELAPHGVMHCAGVDAKIEVKRLEDGLKAKKFRCIKIYLGYVQQYAYDKNYEPAYKLAEKYNVPVVFHTGDTSTSDAILKYADPLTIDEVAVKHRKVNFVIAHLGNPWVDSAAEVVYKNPNVYADISAFLIGDLTEEKPENIEEYVVKPIRWAFGFVADSKKLMYGTDWPLTGMKTYIEAIKRSIPEEHWHEVFYQNAYDIFNFSQLGDVSSPELMTK